HQPLRPLPRRRRRTTPPGARRCRHFGIGPRFHCFLRPGRGVRRRPLPHRGEPRRRCRCRHDLGVPVMLTHATLTATVSAALAEDAPLGPSTCESFLSKDAPATAVLRPRTEGVHTGAEAFTAALTLIDAATSVAWEQADGEMFRAGE